MSTSKVSVLFKINIIIFSTTNINKKYSVYIEPQVIVANGAHPTSVIDNSIPVDLTKFSNAGANTPVNVPIIEP